MNGINSRTKNIGKDQIGYIIIIIIVIILISCVISTSRSLKKISKETKRHNSIVESKMDNFQNALLLAIGAMKPNNY